MFGKKRKVKIPVYDTKHWFLETKEGWALMRKYGVNADEYKAEKAKWIEEGCPWN